MLPSETENLWTISAGDLSIQFVTDENQRLIQRVFSGFQAEEAKGQPAFPGAGNGWVFEPAVDIIHADGNASLDLRVAGVEQAENLTCFTLRDDQYELTLDIFFKALPRLKVIETWTQVSHQEASAIRIQALASASFDLGSDELYLTQFCGDWANEANMVEEKLTPGIKVLDSKLGVRAHQFRAPWVIVSKGTLKENEGIVLAGSLAWSGSYKFSFEKPPEGSTRVIAGVNPFGSTYVLEPGEIFETPKRVWAYGNRGVAEVSQNLHNYIRNNVLRDGQRLRNTLLNNWEATFFDFDEAKIVSLFQGAKDLGMELFLLDDGWFGQKFPRDSDTQGLGDWRTDSAKLPNGIGALTRQAKEKGLKFGLWFEPEMVNPKSKLFEDHPDWAIQQPKRELELQRNQLTLDLSNPEVQEFTFSILDNALTENPEIVYVKWDCNRYLTQPGSTYLSKEKQSHLQIDYVRALYKIMERVAVKHPEVEIMMCSGGGGRVDYGALRYAHEVWPSDMTDPVRRIFIQWGFSYFIPAIAMAAHVTRWGERPLKFCFDVAMSGRLGMDADVDSLSEGDKVFARKAIATYKGIREVVQFGELHRLESPYEGLRSALMYTHEGRAVVFAYATEGSPAGPLKLRGLVPSQTYRVKEVNLVGEERSLGSLSGDDLMNSGIPIEEMTQFGSHVFELAG